MELSTGTCKHVQDVVDFYEATGRAPLPLSGEARTDDAVLERRLYERLKRLRQVSAISFRSKPGVPCRRSRILTCDYL
jgi:hypothetical protein